MTPPLLLLLAATLGAGLMAGTFFAFSAFVMVALARLPPAQGLAAMQAINLAVLNPLFLGVLFGTASLCAVLAVAALLSWSKPAAAWMLAGSLFYLGGTLLVTITGNVPLNRSLARLSPADPAAPERWRTYLTAWTRWNHVRTAAALMATAAFVVALRLA